MTDSATSILGEWTTFYVTIATAAATLVGLLFVMITFINASALTQGRELGLNTFTTPTLVHFSNALLISLLVMAPWHSLAPVAITVGISGLFGILYMSRVMLRARLLTIYEADIEDWIWYSILPFVAYGAIVVGAIALKGLTHYALFGLAIGSGLLVFIGIHNSWDVVSFLAIRGPSTDDSSKDD